MTTLTQLTEMIEAWGERCEETYVPDAPGEARCACCEAWAFFDKHGRTPEFDEFEWQDERRIEARASIELHAINYDQLLAERPDINARHLPLLGCPLTDEDAAILARAGADAMGAYLRAHDIDCANTTAEFSERMLPMFLRRQAE